tara:strand:+ start:1109 stop:1471 length:363 start_codon:yes stop_codon:yes gene_type:complete
MKITKSELSKIIKEVLAEAEPGVAPAAKLKNQAMTGGTFTAGGKNQRKDVSAEVDNNERALIHQIDAFLLKLAALPGVELQSHRTTLQTILKTLEKRIGSSTKQATSPEQDTTTPPNQGV